MNRSRRILYSIISGVLLSLAWLGFPGWILFFALIPLINLENYFVENKNEFTSFSIFGHAFLTFFIWNLLTTWWIMHATKAGAVMAVVVNSFLMSFSWWLAHVAHRKFRSNLGYLGLIVFWISFEYFHYHWDIEWPWLTLGNGFANNVRMVQWYEFTGVFGGSLWILVVNILLFKSINFLSKNRNRKSFILYLSGIALLIIIPVTWSMIRYYTYTEIVDKREIVVVQPNVNPYSESFTEKAEDIKLEKFFRQATALATQNTDFIVGPETVFEYYPIPWTEGQFEIHPRYIEISEFVKQFQKAELVFGATTRKVFQPGEQLTNTARELRGQNIELYNSAVFINNQGRHQVYHKSKLVVGVEKVPFARHLKIVRDLSFNLGGTSGGLGSQKESSVFTAKDGTKIAPVICYESVFGEYVTSYVKKGAQFIFIVTNDGWWKNTPGYKQHLSFARLRAIETRRSIARSANTGISCFINQRGDVSQTTKWWTETAIKGDLNINNKITFYTNYGDYIARISVFSAILLILILVSDKFRKR